VATRKKDREGNEVLKEQLVADYNQSMGNVEKIDSVISQNSIIRKCSKWTTKVAFHLIGSHLKCPCVIYIIRKSTTTLRRLQAGICLRYFDSKSESC